MSVAIFSIRRDGEVVMNPSAKKYLDYCYRSVRAMSLMVDEVGEDAASTKAPALPPSDPA
jgi:hypothetical protein